MNNYICKIATKDELFKRWDYLTKIHPGNEWEKYRKMAIRNFDDESTITYYGFLDGQIICEATAYVKESAFIGDLSDPSGLLDKGMAYLAAFRTNKEFEGKGYFRKLYDFVEEDLKSKGYSELSLGVDPCEVRNIEIYFHLGFKEYIKTLIQRDEISQKEEVIVFYKKKI